MTARKEPGYTESAEDTVYPISSGAPFDTGLDDRNGVRICIGDTIRKHDKYGGYLEGMVVFANGAVRIFLPKETGSLKYNFTLLFDEINGTSNLEVVKPNTHFGEKE